MGAAQAPYWQEVIMDQGKVAACAALDRAILALVKMDRDLAAAHLGRRLGALRVHGAQRHEREDYVATKLASVLRHVSDISLDLDGLALAGVNGRAVFPDCSRAIAGLLAPLYLLIVRDEEEAKASPLKRKAA
jgi:hypothetical protein